MRSRSGGWDEVDIYAELSIVEGGRASRPGLRSGTSWPARERMKGFGRYKHISVVW